MDIGHMQGEALARPCLLAIETLRLEYRHMVGRATSVTLTLNTGYE